MKLKLEKILCKECMQKVRDVQNAETARKKLTKHKNADARAKNIWKRSIAKGMLVCPTLHEEQMQAMLESVGFPFEQQKQIGPYIVDFYIPPQLIVEVDGKIHDMPTKKWYDRERDAYLMRQGYKVMHVKNEEIVGVPIEAIEEIIGRIGDEAGIPADR